jgi:hypothetical protein
MKIYIYEPQGVQSGTGLNTSERVEHLQKVLKDFSPTEIRNIVELRDNNELSNLDIDSNIFIAHYTDVKAGFWEMKTFSKAICVFHTYDTDWYAENISANKTVKEIENLTNRFCIGSTLMKENIKNFIENGIANKKFNATKLSGYDVEFEELLKPFANALPLDENWKGTTLQAAKDKLILEVNKKLK